MDVTEELTKLVKTSFASTKSSCDPPKGSTGRELGVLETTTSGRRSRYAVHRGRIKSCWRVAVGAARAK